MGVTAIASVRSCGVTTLALSLAATWPPDRRMLLAELDPAGGTLAAACGWPSEPSLVSLAAAARRGGDVEMVWQHCQALPAGVAVLAGPAAAEHAGRALVMLTELLHRLGALAADVFVDCGRLDPASAAFAVLDCADLVLLAVRPCLADLHALSAWLDAHPVGVQACRLVVVGNGPYPDAEIAEALGIEVVARMPWDPDAAQAFTSVAADSRELRLAPLARAARTLGDRLVVDLDPAARTPARSTAASEHPVALRQRLLRTWRPAAVPVHSTNGKAPEEVSG
jgi:hypothetical protein